MVFGRLHRLGQTEVQEIIIFAVRGTFDDDIRGKIAQKYVTKLVAEGDFDAEDEKVLVAEAKAMLRKMLGEKGAPLPFKNKKRKAGSEGREGGEGGEGDNQN
ncbi:hypothetical protein NHQ30_011072 [Ciborinia camelliae]|nr:hypothetical protein NHQ30_011072 [Ciborinia camelliae]